MSDGNESVGGALWRGYAKAETGSCNGISDLGGDATQHQTLQENFLKCVAMASATWEEMQHCSFSEGGIISTFVAMASATWEVIMCD